MRATSIASPLPRFYAPDASAGAAIELPAEEGTHLTRVLRLGVGSPVRLFDGRGHEFDGTVQRAGARVDVSVGRSRTPDAPETRVAITLIPAVLKGDGTDSVVRDAVMLGVARIQPIVTTRTEISLASLGRARRRERWQRVAVAAAKQCGRAVVPEVAEPIDLGSVLEAGGADRDLLMCVEPSAGVEATGVHGTGAPGGRASLLVGPEGGWTPDEIEQARAVCRFVRLGGRRLRADATPIVALSALMAIWNEL